MTAWIWVVVIALVLMWITLRLARMASREMPPLPEPDDRPWQPKPGGFARCPGCGTLRPTAFGLIEPHIRPAEDVPPGQPSTACFGSGLPAAPRPIQPADSGDGGPDPRVAPPAAGHELRGDAPTSGSG